jgi:predicted amidohydrolase
MKVRIAVVQFSTAQAKPSENLQKAERFVKEAKEKNAEIIVFPEDFIDAGELKKEFVDFDGKYLRFFQALAKEHEVDMVPGSWTEGDGEFWYNTAYYIDKFGNVKGKYRKINPWLSERKQITPGKEVAVFETRFGRVGLAICYDLVLPEIFREMAIRGVQLVFCPSWWENESTKPADWITNESLVVDSLCIARAFENNLIMIYCNIASGIYDGKINDAPVGHSQIALPLQVVEKLNHNKEEMFVKEIDTSILEEVENVFRIRKDLRNKNFLL